MTIVFGFFSSARLKRTQSLLSRCFIVRLQLFRCPGPNPLLPTHLERAADSFKDSFDSQPWLCSCCRCTLHPDADSHCVCTRHSYERRRTRARPAHIKTLQQLKRQTTTGRNGRRRPRRRPDCAGPDCAFSFDFSMLPCSTASFLRPWAESMAKTSAAQVVNHQIFSWRENGSTRHAAGLLPLSYLR